MPDVHASSSHAVSECSLAAPRIRFAERDTNGFRRLLNARVEAHFARSGKSRLAGPALHAKAAVLLAVAVGFYAAMLLGGWGAWATLGCALVYGVAVLLLGMNIAHDAAHLAVTGRARADRTIQRVLFALLGVDGYLWRMRHDGSHHVFPNVNGCDIDIDENRFLRLSPNHARRPWHRFQHLYAPVLYMLTLSDSVFSNDLKYLFKKDLTNMRGITHARSQVALFFAGKLFYLVLSIVLPLMFIRLPWWQVLLGYAAVNALVSLVFVFLLIGTHFSTFAEFPPLGADGRLESSWAAHALSTSLDWAPQSRLASLIAGGANCHAAHHLFPRVSHVHYRAITKIVKETAAECGVRYNETTFFGMVASHFAHLRRMGNDGALPLLLRVGVRVPPRLVFGVYRALY